MVYDEAFSQNYGITVQGGDDIASYYLALGYNGAHSVLKENNMNRLNIRSTSKKRPGSLETIAFS